MDFLKRLHNKPSRKKLLVEGAFLLAVLVTIVAALSLVYREAGWPQNHDHTNIHYRTVIYAEHIKQGDIFPVWSVNDGFGMGTPMPLFYHKTHNYVSSVLYLITDNLKLAVTASVGIFLLIGAYGMRLAARLVTDRAWIWFTTPLALLLANYTFTNWLVRGAVAELSAAMIIPFLLWWCIKLVRDKQFSWWIGPIVAALFLSHNAIGMMSFAAVGAAYVLYLRQAGFKAGLQKTYKRALFSVFALAVLVAPMLIAQMRIGADYDPAVKIVQESWTPTEQFRSPIHYFYDPSYTWLADWDQLNIQIDIGIWVPVFALVVVLAVLIAKKRERTIAKYFNPWVLGLLLLAGGFYFFLQLSSSARLYHLFPPLELIQFPWRLLAYITPIGLLVVAMGFEAMFRKFGDGPRMRIILPGIVACWLLGFVVLSPLTHQFKDDFYPTVQTEQIANPTDDGHLIGGGEYLPKTIRADGSTIGKDAMQSLYHLLREEGRRAEPLSDTTCEFARGQRDTAEPQELHFTVSCANKTQFALPVSYSKYLQVYEFTPAGQRAITFERLPTDPRAVITADHATEIGVRVPTFWKILFGK